MKNVLILLVVLTLFSCAKKGEEGEAGPQGIPGTSILSGTSNPSAEIGRKGDFYINLQTESLFGPKSSGWGPPYRLKGYKGNKGTDGGRILTGKDEPSPSTGNPWDYYIDTKNSMLYGPKRPQNSTPSGDNPWGEPVSLLADKEMGITSYLIKPDWDEHIYKTSDPENPNANAWSRPSPDSIPGYSNNTYFEFYVTAGIPKKPLKGTLSENDWIPLKDFVEFPEVTEPFFKQVFTDVRVYKKSIENGGDDTKKFYFEISMHIDEVGSYDEPYDFFDDGLVWILVRSVPYSIIEKTSEKYPNAKRYLRLQDD